ncbi:glycoside hydrolase family 97 protein [Ferruginibacter sp.]|nr:glycoside hydrolase family 97 protein [Ferruginibacter sp.]
MKKYVVFCVIALAVCFKLTAQNKVYELYAPNKNIVITVDFAGQIKWSVKHLQTIVTSSAAIAMQTEGNKIWGKDVKVIAAKTKTVNEKIKTVAYKKDTVDNNYNELLVQCKGGYGLIFRAYNNAAAYRFFTTVKDSLFITGETAGLHLAANDTLLIPPTSDLRGGEKYTCSFEEFYTHTTAAGLNADTLGYLPLLIKLPDNKKAVYLETDIQDYPAMFIRKNKTLANSIEATFANYPAQEKLGGYSNINYMVTQRENYLAKTAGNRMFPWRVLVVSQQDKELLNCDIVYQLAEKNKIENTSWIKPGKVAWDWWNDWNISHVDFKAGINTPTYKYYIDFAAKNNIEYIVLDEGWSDDWDLNKLSDKIDLKELINYGKQKNVDLILWSTWYALAQDIEGLCSKYAAMGIKGFKVDFLDRNDQKMIVSAYEIAAVAAKHKLLIDYHGTFPPQGLQVTYPNVINFEAVRGMEWSKWSADERVPQHEVTLPFIRMMAGPMDYTPGAMRNVTKGNAKASHSLPVSQGTRCHQLAMYVLYDAPLQMLADNPTVYYKEQECTDLITSIPTTFNETIALDSKLAEYVCIAKKANGIWYVGGLNNWAERELSIDLSFLPKGNYTIEIFKDGLNAGKDATDYTVEKIQITNEGKLKINMASGGGFVATIK